jgi:hypothetical protein
MGFPKPMMRGFTPARIRAAARVFGDGSHTALSAEFKAVGVRVVTVFDFLRHSIVSAAAVHSFSPLSFRFSFSRTTLTCAAPEAGRAAAAGSCYAPAMVL